MPICLHRAIPHPPSSSPPFIAFPSPKATHLFPLFPLFRVALDPLARVLVVQLAVGLVQPRNVAHEGVVCLYASMFVLVFVFVGGCACVCACGIACACVCMCLCITADASRENEGKIFATSIELAVKEGNANAMRPPRTILFSQRVSRLSRVWRKTGEERHSRHPSDACHLSSYRGLRRSAGSKWTGGLWKS